MKAKQRGISREALDREVEAEKLSLSADVKLAEANAERQTRLMKEDATSQSDFDSAINSLASARSSQIQLQLCLTKVRFVKQRLFSTSRIGSTPKLITKVLQL